MRQTDWHLKEQSSEEDAIVSCKGRAIEGKVGTLVLIYWHQVLGDELDFAWRMS